MEVNCSVITSYVYTAPYGEHSSDEEAFYKNLVGCVGNLEATFAAFPEDDAESFITFRVHGTSENIGLGIPVSWNRSNDGSIHLSIRPAGSNALVDLSIIRAKFSKEEK